MLPNTFLSIVMHNFNHGKRSPKMWATSVIFELTIAHRAKIGRKFAQSGHFEAQGYEERN
jgi:hypothetical protein